MRDSNSRHPRCKRGALPTELIALTGEPGKMAVLYAVVSGIASRKTSGLLLSLLFATKPFLLLDSKPPIAYQPSHLLRQVCAGVAQSVRVLACHARGRGFKSRHSRHFCDNLIRNVSPTLRKHIHLGLVNARRNAGEAKHRMEKIVV